MKKIALCPMTSVSLALFALLYLTRLPLLLTDGDAAWHWATGVYIRSHGMPVTDPWSFTAGQTPWLNISWLFDLALGGVPLPWGMAATVLISAATAATFTGLAWRATGSVIACMLVGWACGLLLSNGVSMRPQLISYLLLALLLTLCESARARPHMGKALLAMPLMLLWVNMHGAFPLGLMVIGLYALTLRRQLFLAMLAAALLVLPLNPYGFGLIEAVQRTLGSALAHYVGEWRPLDPTQELFPAGVLLLLWILLLWQWRRLTVTDGLLAMLGTGLALLSIRHIPVMAVLIALPLARAAAALIAQSPRLAARDAGYARDLHHYRPGLWACLAMLALLGWSVMGQGAQFHGRYFPLDAQRHVPEGARLLNHYDFGGSLIASGLGGHFIDGRAETAFPPEVVAAYIAFAEQRPGWEEMLDSYRINAVLLPPNDPVVPYFRTHWHEAYADEEAAVFLRKDIP